MDAFTNTTPEKMAAWSSPPPCSLLDKHIESVSSLIYLSSAWFVSGPVAVVSAPAWGQTCVYCTYYGMLRKERVGRGAGAPFWCHTEVFETQRVINSVSSCRLFSGGKGGTPALIGVDVLRVPRLWSNRRSVSVRAGPRLAQNRLFLNWMVKG